MSGVSVVMAAYNGATYIAEAIESVLRQSVPPDQLIVVDDGSSDNSPDIARGFGDRVTVLRQANTGQAGALLAGLALATGKFLAFNDQDDCWAPDKLERQLAALEADPGLDAVFGMSEQFVSPELPPAAHVRLAPPQVIMVGQIAQCMLLRRTAYERIGPFDRSTGGAFFVEWLSRAKRSGFRELVLDAVLLRRRLHLTNYGRVNVAERNRDHLAALRRDIELRRLKPKDPT
jgi:glycosyltransferase involved in cell wall biosynthesis